MTTRRKADPCADGHLFFRVSDERVACSRCGEFRAAPGTYPVPYVVPMWPYWPSPPTYYPWIVTSGSVSSGSVTVGNTAPLTIDAGNTTYTVGDLT